MTISTELFMAILAMDSYNRGYNFDINFSKVAELSGNDLVQTRIGDATLGISSHEGSPPFADQAISFFAQSYSWENQTVISYRGTDELSKDMQNGYGVGFGVYGGPFAPQGDMAVQFYQTVLGNSDPDSVTLTGHSLGGGLAGLVGGMYGSEAYTYDSMPFMTALLTYSMINDPSLLSEPKLDLHGYYISGEMLETARSLQDDADLKAFPVLQFDPYTTYLNVAQMTPLDNYSMRNPLDLHNIALLISVLYARDHNLENWQYAAGPLWAAFFAEDIATAVGFKKVKGGNPQTTLSKVMRDAIAYSALDSGTQPFGDTAMAAMFDDADDLGQALHSDHVSNILQMYASDLAKISMQYAGQLALGHVLQSDDHSEALHGVLQMSADGESLAVDFSDGLWQLGQADGTATTNILGREQFIQDLFERAGYNSDKLSGNIRAAIQWLWPGKETAGGDMSPIIARIALAANGEALHTTLADGVVPSNKVTLFVSDDLDPIRDGLLEQFLQQLLEQALDPLRNPLLATYWPILASYGKNDWIAGSSGRDCIFSGYGNDTLYGEGGNDCLNGGSGDDWLCGGSGNNFLDGGSGTDTVFFDNDSPVTLTLQAVPGQANVFALDRADGGSDRIERVEQVQLTGYNDTLRISQPVTLSDENVWFKGGEGYDTLDFSKAASPVYLDSARTNWKDIAQLSSAPKAVEVYTQYSSLLHSAQWLINPGSASGGQGVYGGTGLRFSGFEHVVGSAHDDIMNLWQLGPDGAAAGQTITVEAGAGDDTVIGTASGTDYIYGGDGNDKLVAGGSMSALHGGAGNDTLVGGGVESDLYGEGGANVFQLANGTFVMDATTQDYAYWGPLRLTGGVRQWWMEGAWAYWSPFSSLVLSSPGLASIILADPLGLMLSLVDVPCMLAVRYGLTVSHQLIIQFARGLAGQAVINNYQFNLDTGVGTANIAVFQSVLGHGTLEDYGKYINDALRAGFGICANGTDPLVLDLAGAGISLSSQRNGVYFDMNHNGFAVNTAWLTSGEAFLVQDRNHNGRIDDGSELFGNSTLSGFDQLREFDVNSDGVISAADSDFGELAVWEDANGNGITDSGELMTLAQAGIVSIALTATASGAAVNGSHVAETASFTRADGTTSTIAEVLLDTNQTDTQYRGDSTVSAAAAALSNLKGYGTMTDLDIAMTGDSALLSAVSVFDALPSMTGWSDLRQAALPILFRWAGVDTQTAVPMGGGAFDRQRLAFLEKYFGYSLTPRDSGGKPAENNLDTLLGSWNDVLAKMTLRLAVQGPLSSMFKGVVYDAGSDAFKAVSATSLTDIFTAVLGQLASSPATAADSWRNNWQPLLAGLDDALYRSDGNAVKADYVVQCLVAAMNQVTAPLTLQQLVSGLGLTGVLIAAAPNATLARRDTGLEIYVAGTDNDTLQGGNGQDVYVFGERFGHAVIRAEDAYQNGDRIRFAGYSASDVAMTHVGDDLYITVKKTGDTVIVKNQFATPIVDSGGIQRSAYQGIEEIQFADGTVDELDDIAAAVGLGTDGSDTIAGTGQDDQIQGLKGDDRLMGGDGGDTYYYSQGDGHDTIADVMTNPLLNNPDSLVLMGGLTAADLVLTRSGDSNDLVIHLPGDGDSITIENQFMYTPLGYQTKLAMNDRIEMFMFSQGQALSWQDIQAMTIAAYTTDGADATYGFGTPDQFYSSAGNDTLMGLDGGDTYRFDRGSGQDEIWDQSTIPGEESIITDITKTAFNYSWGAADTLVFGPGIALSDITFRRPSAAPDLLITVKDDPEDTMTVKGQFAAVKLDAFNLLGLAWDDRIERFQFADGTELSWQDVIRIVDTGTSGDDSLYGTMIADTLDGGAGNDYLSGGDGDDVYRFGLGYGQDVIEDNQTNVLLSSNDTLLFGQGIDVGDVVFRRDGATNDLLVAIKGTADALRIVGQYDVFETGVFGAQAFDRIENFRWADGTVKTWAELTQQLIAQAATPGNDLICGTWGDDTLTGGAGDDTLEGGNGSDTYLFGLGDGKDVVIDNWDNILADNRDRIVFGAGISAADVIIERCGGNLQDVTLSIAGTDDSISVLGQFDYTSIRYSSNEIESFCFADGTVWSAEDLRNHYLAQQGTTGNDTIVGFFSDDTLDGGAGNDRLAGGDGNDTYVFDAGFGQDTIEESVGNIFYSSDDTAVFTGVGLTAANAVLSRDGDDLRIGFRKVADQVTIAGQFADAAWFGSWTSVEHFRFADGVTWTEADIRHALIAGSETAGNDVVRGFWTADTLDGGAGDDTLIGMGGGDTFVFGQGYGQDVIEDVSGNMYDNQSDRVSFQANVDRNSVDFSRNQDDLVVSLRGTDDTLTIRNVYTAGGSNLQLFQFADGSTLTVAQVEAGIIQSAGTPGNDRIIGTDASDVLDGGAGDDTLQGGANDDTLIGGSGDDLLEGDSGNDTYMFCPGFGRDVIKDSGGDHDVVCFMGAGLTAGQAILSRSGNDLVIGFQGVDDQVTIQDPFSHMAWFGNDQEIEKIQFADGVTWTGADIRQKLIAQEETGGNDSVIGFWGDDTLDGGAGNDTLCGRGGGDTYLFGKGSGQDVIQESVANLYEDQADTLLFGAGITAADVVFHMAGNDLLVSLADSPDTVTVKNHFWSDDNAVERFQFADGTVFTAADINRLVIQSQETAGDDSITGTSANDTLLGLAGNDTLQAGNGDDVLDGGTGNDLLEGGDGNDTYVFDSGFGHDTIAESLGYIFHGSTDTAVFTGAGLTAANAVLSRNGNDLSIGFRGVDDQVTIVEQFTDAAWFGSWTSVEKFRFADGVTWTEADVRHALIAGSETAGSDVVRGFWTADTLDGGAGDDTLIGMGGGDTFVFGKGYGRDVIEDISDNMYDNQPDTVSFQENIHVDDVSFTRNDNDLVVSLRGTDDTLTIRQLYVSGSNLQQFRFTDGSTLSVAQAEAAAIQATETSGSDLVAGTDGNDTLFGLAGNDTLQAGGGDDVLDGGLGNDLLQGGSGNDTYQFGANFGRDVIQDSGGRDTVCFTGAGLTSVNALLSRSGDDLVIGFQGLDDQVTIQDPFSHILWFGNDHAIENFQFADGITWTDKDIRRKLVEQMETGGDDLVTGFWDDDTLDGGAGNDTLCGLGGGDTYLFGKGSGQDVIEESLGSHYEDQPDTLLFGAGITAADVVFSMAGNDLLVSLADSPDTVTVKNHFGSSDNAVEQFRFADGTAMTDSDINRLVVTAQETAGDDSITGTSDNDTIVGGAGNDTIQAKSGDDVLDGGAGDDVLDAGSGDDVLDGGSGNDLLQGGSGNDTYQFGANFGRDVIQDFSGNHDMVRFTGAGLTSVNALLSRSGDDLVIGFQGVDDQVTIQDPFSHTLWFGNDHAIENFQFADGIAWTDKDIRRKLVEQMETSGDDLVTGFWDDDTLDGGAGNDTLCGLGGGDTYLFGKGSGQDVIEESLGSCYEDQPDTLLFGAGITAADVVFGMAGNDLLVSLADSSDTVTVKNHFGSSDNAVEQFRFADGTAMTANQVKQLAIMNIWADTSFALGADSHNLTLTGTDSITGTGNSLSGVLTANSGNDTLIAGSGDETLVAGSGTSLFEAGAGNDTFVWDSFCGDTAINAGYTAEHGNQTMIFQGLAEAMIEFTASGSNLICTDTQNAHKVGVTDWMLGADNQIGTFRFADGTLTAAQINSKLV